MWMFLSFYFFYFIFSFCLRWATLDGSAISSVQPLHMGAFDSPLKDAPSPAYRLHINTRTSQSAVHVQVHPYAVTSSLSLTFHFPSIYLYIFFSERAVFLLQQMLLLDKEDITHTIKDTTKKSSFFFFETD